MESAKDYEQVKTQQTPTQQQQPTQYYTQDPNTGAQQVYYLNGPVQNSQPLPQQFQPQIQYVQSPVQVVQVQQQQRNIFL